MDLFHAGCRVQAIEFHGRWRSNAFYVSIRDNGPLRAQEVLTAVYMAVAYASDLVFGLCPSSFGDVGID